MVFVNEKLINKTCHYIKKNNKIREDITQSVYDPRVKFNIISDNLALILAEIMIRSNYVKKTEDFWRSIAVLADYCDQRI